MNVILTKDDILQACKEYLERKYSITFHPDDIIFTKMTWEAIEGQNIEIKDVTPVFQTAYEHFSTIPVPEK